MDNGLNNYLKKISSELFIKKRSLERYNIDRSLGIIIENLEDYFEDEISNVLVFGSYARDTILPRICDEHSDIDIMIEFNTTQYDELKPESYRSKLKKFADLKYPKALSAKDHPSIVIELNHIKFDLVPSIFDKGWLYDSIEIPDKDGGWMETEPEKFNKKLTEANKKYNSIVKPIVRLLKYWNASHDYPYTSYDLERRITMMDFSSDNFESGFLYAIKNLSSTNFPNWAKNELNTLQEDGSHLRKLLKNQEITKAKTVVERILPGFL
jgi:predicted nucleotidyltransferase